MEYSIIVLAAGYSHRFGSDKRLACINGEPMLVATVRNILAAVEEEPEADIQVVLRASDGLVAQHLTRLPVQVLHAPVWPVSIGSSLSSAVEQLSRQGVVPRAVMVCLGDMPFVEPETVRILLQAADEDSICVPVCAGTRGYPIVIGRRFLSALARLRRNGLEKILQLYGDAVRDVEVQDPAINCDINRPEDYHAAVRQDLFGKILPFPDTLEDAPLPSASE